MPMSKLGEIARDPQTAALIGAGTGAVKGALVGLAVGKVALFVTLGVVGGAISGTIVSRLARARTAGPVPVRIPTRPQR